MKLINGYALVEVLKKENKLKGGIIISDNDLVNDEGIVIEVDPSVGHIVEVGDKVKFNPNLGHEMEYMGKNCRFLRVYDKDSPRTDIVFKYGK